MKRFKGQGLVEYILIIALIALLVIGAIKFFGGKVKKSFTEAGKRVEEVVDEGIEEGKKDVSQ